MTDFNIIDVELKKKKINGSMDSVRVFAEPDCYIAAGSFSRGLFLCKELETPVSSYILLPNGGTCYANELLTDRKELFGYLDGEQITCKVFQAVLNRVDDFIVDYQYSEPLPPDSVYRSLGCKELPYNLDCSEDTILLPKLVKFNKGTHFGKRIDRINCIEI